MRRLNNQKGMTFISWLVVASVFIFLAITVIKVAPMYVKYNSIKSLVDDISTNPSMLKANKKAIFSKVNDYININGIYDVTDQNFTIEKIPGSKKQRILAVNYQDRQTWFANLDIIGNFEYSKVIGAE